MITFLKPFKLFRLVFLSISLFLFSLLTYGQEGFSIESDTSSAEEYGFFSIPEIDYEIEKINAFLNRTSKIIADLNERLDADTTYKAILARTEREAYDFDSYAPEDLSKFFLENSHRIWTSYKVSLKRIQSESFDLLTNSDLRNKSLEKQEKTWEKTYENTKNYRIPKIQVDKIKSIQKRINKQHNDNYKISLRIITYEAVISNRLNFVVNKLNQIEELQNIYRDNLFVKTNTPIWGINLNDSSNRSIVNGFKQAWHDNTKYIFNNYNSYYISFNKFLFFSLLLLIIHFLLRAKYLKKFGDIRKTKQGDLNFLIFQNPISSAISVVLFIFFVVFKNIPLAVSGIVNLALLLSIYFTLKVYFSQVGGRLIKKFIILLLLNTLEIVVWYLGDYSRIYLFFESSIGIWFTYYYVTPYFKYHDLSSFRFKILIKPIRYPLFIIFILSFIANIGGYVNLSVFLQKLGIHFTVIVIVVLGIWHIVNSFLHLLTDLISRNEKLRLKIYLPLLTKRISQIFKLYFAYIIFNAFLFLFDINHSFYEALNDFFTIPNQVGSISFTFLDILLFVFVLLLSWALNTLIKIIFDEDNFRKFESMRGIPSAISMTLRILFTSAGVFFAFSAAGFDMKSFSIILGALGVGIGFGLQNVVNNYISGLILIYERPVQKGDIVEVNSLLGEVVDIGIRRSNVRTFDGAEVIIPNANLTSNELINWTLSDKHKRLDIRVGVSYNSNPNLVLSILQNITEKNPLVTNIPAPRVLFDEFGNSSLNFRILCWVLLDNALSVKSNLSVEIFNAFEENGIEIPFPQIDLHVKDAPTETILNKKKAEKITKNDPSIEGIYDSSGDSD